VAVLVRAVARRAPISGTGQRSARARFAFGRSLMGLPLNRPAELRKRGLSGYGLTALRLFLSLHDRQLQDRGALAH
jgi:hypothetical protein